MDRFAEPAAAAAASMNGEMEVEEPIYDVSTDDAVDIGEDEGGARQSKLLQSDKFGLGLCFAFLASAIWGS